MRARLLFLAAVQAAMVFPVAAGATPLTLKIDYPGIVANAEDEISRITFDNGTASFDHEISNISPQLLQLTVLGTQLSELTLTAYDGSAALGSLLFDHVILTSVTHSGAFNEHVTFGFPASAGFYRVSYPGIAANAENQISSLTLTGSSAGFEHPISNISVELLQLTAAGTPLSAVTFTQDAGPFFGNLTFDDAIFTGIALSGGGVADPFEDVSLAFRTLAIQAPIQAVPEPASAVLLGCGILLAGRAGHRRRPATLVRTRLAVRVECGSGPMWAAATSRP